MVDRRLLERLSCIERTEELAMERTVGRIVVFPFHKNT